MSSEATEALLRLSPNDIVPLKRPKLTLSPATASPSPRKKTKMKMKMVVDPDLDGEGEEEGSGDHSQDEQGRGRGRVMIDGSPSPSASSLHSRSGYYHNDNHAHHPSSSSFLSSHVYAPSDESTQMQMQIIKEDSPPPSLSSGGSGEGVAVEDKMPPKMRKRWIHQSADTLKDTLKSAGSAGVNASGSGSGSGSEDGEKMEVDNGVFGSRSGSDPQASESTSPHSMPPPPMPASLDPTTVVSTSTFPITTTITPISAHPIRTTSPYDFQTQTSNPTPSPSTSFAKLSLLSPIVPSAFSPSISSLSPGSFPFPHTVPRHNTALPSPLSQSRLHSSIGGGRGGANPSLWRDRSAVGKEPESPQSLMSAAAFERKRPPGPEGHAISLDEQASQRSAAEEETTKNANDTSPPTYLRPPPFRSPTPPERAKTPPPLPPPTQKVKMSLKEFALRKRKQREQEMANQAASSVSPGRTTSALKPAVSVGGEAAAESVSPRVNGIEMEGVESCKVASENGEADAMAVDTPAEEDTSSFPNGVVDDREDSEEPIVRIKGSPTHMRSPSPSRSPLPDKDMRPHMPNGIYSLKAQVELVDDPMMPTDTVIPEKALRVKDSQLELRSPLNGTAEKRVIDPNPTSSAVEGGQDMSARQLRKILRRRENNKKKKEIKAYTPDGLDIEGRDFECEFCHRMFERWGLICHLRGKHTDKILPSVEQDTNLRKPKRTPDHEFMEKLKPYLIR